MIKKKKTPLRIKKIISTYDITKFVKILKKQEELIEKSKKLNHFYKFYGFSAFSYDFLNIESKIQKNFKIIEKFKMKLNSNFLINLRLLFLLYLKFQKVRKIFFCYFY